ncbi:MAG: putative transport system permease protein, partial [Actinomycetota bacterium]|nr:putative transport system permease protein [Actinomycetota bacterium]
EQVRKLPEVKQATGLRFGAMKIAGDDKSVSVVDPATAPDVFDLEVQKGSMAGLRDSQVGVSDVIAEEKGYRIGTTLDAQFPDGFATKVSVATIYGAHDVAGNWIVGQPAWNAHAVSNTDAIVFVKLRNGVSIQQGKQAVQRLASAYPGAKVRDKAEFAKEQAKFVNQLLALVYVMLTLAIIIALLGIANTLSLSVYERTRELGLLRAVGMTRGQLRSSVRWEAVVVALFGAVGGLGLGVFLGWALVKGAGKGGFTTVRVPVGSLVAVLVLAAFAGVLAGLRAAGKAGRLNVLEAIAAD